MKKKLLELLQQNQSEQTASLTPIILMAVAAMSDEDVTAMLWWLRDTVNTILIEGDDA